MAEEKKSNRDRFRERYAKRYPDVNMDDEEAYYGQANSLMDEYEGYESNSRRMREQLAKSPAFAEMMVAARTAPKGKGVDIIEIAMVTESNIRILSDTMKQMYEENGLKFFLRDADNILDAECIILIGTREQPQGLDCGHCGYETCASRKEGVPCAINSIDVGIAIGSACSVAADHRVDTRVMFSAGLAAQQLDWLDGCRQVYAIPVSASSKNPFFDRKPKTE